jgi:hypothetical protein
MNSNDNNSNIYERRRDALIELFECFGVRAKNWTYVMIEQELENKELTYTTIKKHHDKKKENDRGR